jgi:hypothetical protein
MRRPLTLISCLALILTLALAAATTAQAPAPAQALVDNPQYTSWSKHKPGTSVTMKMTTNMGPQNMTMNLVQTLKEVNADQATIEVKSEMDMGGNKQQMPAQTVPIKAKVTPQEAKYGQLPAGVKADVKEVGNETLTVGGKTYDCKVSEVTGEAEGMKTAGKVWRNDDVPGQVVKMDMKFEGAQSGTSTMELVSVDKK